MSAKLPRNTRADETGMQALERLHETKPVRPGLVEHVELE